LVEGDPGRDVDSGSNEKRDEFDGRSLRALLSTSGLDALRKFVTICNENKERDLAAEYLLAGGGVLEVLKLLDLSDKKNISSAITVFSAINILLMKYVYTGCLRLNQSTVNGRFLRSFGNENLNTKMLRKL